MKGSSWILVLAISGMIFAVGCGGSSGATAPATTRIVSGTITPAASNAIVAKAYTSGACTQITPNICRVIATDTNGGTVMDEDLTGCAFSLQLTIGSNYVISFVGTGASGACDQFVATLVSSTGGNLFNIGSGDTEILLGALSIDPTTGKAEATGSLDDLFGESYSCAELGIADSDDDDVCDNFEDIPGADDFEGQTACTQDSDCTDGKTCSNGICVENEDDGGSGTIASCTQNEDCDEGEWCNSGSCTASGIGDIVGTYVDPSTNGGATCEDDIESLPYTETVTVDGETAMIAGAVNPDNAVFGCRHDATALPLVDLQGELELDCYTGCPMDNTINTFVFDTNVTPFTLTRTITTVIDGFTFTEGCQTTYERVE